MQPFDQSRRARVGGGGNGRLGLAAALLGAGLLILMVTIGTIDAPPPPTATPLLVAPGPSPAATPAASPTPAPWAPEFLYLIRRGPTADPAVSRRFLEVIEASSSQTVYTLDDVADAILSADGRTMYLLTDAEVIALSAVTPGERWRAPLPEQSRYALDSESGSRLALSADGRTLLVLRQQIDGRLGRRLAWIERYASDSGLSAGPRVDIDPVAWNPLLIGGADETAIVVAGTAFSSINLADGGATTLMEPAIGPFAAALLPRQNQIYVASGEGVLTRMSRYDPSQDRRSMVLSADVRPSFGVDSMAVSPNGELVALVLERPGPPVVHAGLLTNDGSSIRLSAIDPNTGTIRRQAELPDDSWITHLAFSGDGTLVYFAANSRLYRWHLESNAVSEVALVGGGVERLVVGPAWRGRLPDLTPSATPAVTPTPRPLPPALTRPATDTLAWLWPLRHTDSNRDVVAYAADGSARLVAASVDTTVSRPGQTPLLLRSTGQREWQILDPSAQTTATVRFDAQPRPLLYRDGGFLPSPDGQAIAFLANDDLIATDALTDASQLMLIDVRTGELRALAGLDRLEERLNWQTAQWAAGGIYVFSQSPAAATIRSATALWRIDPAAPALERLLGFATPGAYASLNAAAGLVLYEAHTDDPAGASLRLIDLNGGAETVVMERGPFINSHEASISPDGRFVAYLRPTARPGALDLVLYDVAARRERRLLNGMLRYGAGDLLWSGRSSLHLLRYEPQGWLGVVADDVWELGDLVPTRPQRRFSAAPSWLSGSGSGWLERRRFASLEWLGEHALLRRISLDPAPSVEVVLPLPAGPNALVTGETGVIYEP